MSAVSTQHQISWYPQSHPIALPMRDALAAMAQRRSCSSVYLDTDIGMGGGPGQGKNHHQGLARSHRLSDRSIYFFLTHSEVDGSGWGSISSYRFSGPTDGDHVLSAPRQAPALRQTKITIDDRSPYEQHPSDLVFLPDVNHYDAGYLFVTQEYQRHSVSCYRWAPDGSGLVLLGDVRYTPPGGDTSAFGAGTPWPNLVFIDCVDGIYHLGIASGNRRRGVLLTAAARDLFRDGGRGSLDVGAFTQHTDAFDVPDVAGASQVKLVRDGLGDWYLFGFRGDPCNDPRGTNSVDVYPVSFDPFSIGGRRYSVRLVFTPGDTGFANTGTHHVERTGRLLISSSGRWASDAGGRFGYVSRVDELSAATGAPPPGTTPR